MYKINKKIFKVNSFPLFQGLVYNGLNLNSFSNLKLFIPLSLSIGTEHKINCNVMRGLSTLIPTNNEPDKINKNLGYSDTININKGNLILSLAKKKYYVPCFLYK